MSERKIKSAFKKFFSLDASAVIIALTYGQFTVAGCIALSVACIGIAFTRIVGGVHYPTDIVAAIALSLACGLIGFM